MAFREGRTPLRRPPQLLERWKDKDDVEAPVIQSCTILTTDANAVVRPVHDRMLVIVPPADFSAWLDRRTPSAELHNMLRPYLDREMVAAPVSRSVNNLRSEGPQCLAP